MIFNITFFASPGIKDQFLSWACDVFMPAAKAAGMTDIVLCRVVGNPAEGEAEEHLTYALRLTAPSAEHLEAWIDEGGLTPVNRLMTQLGTGNILCHSTMMEEVSHL